jgi:hypothetical protein
LALKRHAALMLLKVPSVRSLAGIDEMFLYSIAAFARSVHKTKHVAYRWLLSVYLFLMSFSYRNAPQTSNAFTRVWRPATGFVLI